MKLSDYWSLVLPVVRTEAEADGAVKAPRSMKAAAMRSCSTAAAIAIFIADTITSLDIAVATLYVAVILMAGRFLRPRGITIAGLGCIALTFVSWYLAPPAVSSTLAVTNEFISIGAIALVTGIARHVKRSEAALFDSERRLRDVQSTLAHANRLTTLGELMASLSHELKQPISASATNAEAGVRWLDFSPPNVQQARESFERIIKDAARADAVIERTRGLSRKSVLRKDVIQLNDAIGEVVALLHHEFLKQDVAVQTRLEDKLPLVEADRIQLQQVMLNLVMNAIEAMSALKQEPRKLVIETATDRSRDVLVTVQDTGPGFAAENADQLFEPFYTTKSSGMGMGLAICASIVRDHGGRLWADTSGPAGGSVFRFTLPRVSTRAASTSKSPIASS